MKLIKVNSDYYLLSDDTTDTGGKFIMWLGETVEHFPKQATPQINKYTIVPNSIYSGKPADGYKLLIATSNGSFSKDVPMISRLSVERLLGIVDEDVLAGEIVRVAFDNSGHLITACDKVKEKIVTLREQYESEKFSKEELFVFVGFFNEKIKQGVSGENIFNEFKSISKKSEWDVECEMEEKQIDFPDEQEYQQMSVKDKESCFELKIKVNEQGFINIKSVK